MYEGRCWDPLIPTFCPVLFTFNMRNFEHKLVENLATLSFDSKKQLAALSLIFGNSIPTQPENGVAYKKCVTLFRIFHRWFFFQANNLVDDIRRAFIGILHNLPWMDDTTAQVAEKKAKKIEQKIGYPQFIMKTEELDKYYKGVHAFFKTTL